MSSEENKAIVRHYVEAFNAGDFTAAAEHFAPDAVQQCVLAEGGITATLKVWEQLHAAFPDHHHEIAELAAEDDTVAVRLTDRGTFTGQPFLGMSPTGRSFELVAMEWFHISDGKISRRWAARDSGAMLRHLGVTT